MEKLDGKTSDIVAGNKEKLRELFPEAFTEGKVDFTALKKALGESIDTENERYSMSWHGKSDAIKMALKQSTATLLPQKAESKDWDTTENLFIEGDNLEVLRVLQDSYRGKVKMIYIDPPYNTGHDFVYTDSFSDNIKNYKEKVCTAMQANADTSGRYHTNWLNMMYPRLRLARNLLKDDGVIFISIDDNEQANLKKICDEIFGEENFISSFVWHNNVKGRQMDLYVKNTYESILMYSKNFENLKVATQKDFVDVSSLESDEISHYKKDYPLHNGTADFHINNRPNLAYSIYYNPITLDAKTLDEKIKNEGSLVIGSPSEVGKDLIQQGYFRIIPKYNNTYNNQRVWRWGAPKFLLEYKTELLFESEADGYYIYQKKRFENGIHEKTFKNYINIDSGTGKKELNDILGNKLFDSPKPVSLIKILLQIGSEDEDLILDFFSGSGTTAHAVMDLNAEDGGNRKWICVQIPEGTGDDSEACKAGYKTIADIGKERIRRAGEKIKKDSAEKLVERATPLDTGFKVFALDETNFTQWDSDTKDIQASLLEQLSPLKENRTDEDAVYEILLKYGIDPTTPIEELSLAGKKVFSLAGNYLLICLEKKITLDTIEEMAKLAPHRAVFYDNGFADDTVKANAEQTLKKAGVKEIMVI